ncbi:hypothetical protein M6K083_1279 [Staphylococcus aureus]|nr:Uncharacterised protein [Staphylococcus aureus]SCS98192.1 Uncharacterised protein [Staphylococcus aureus]SCU58964.1 Uncharacterised protein [Staphylococcus aureus]SGU16086.1 Uncharacterised protein [Staphylococcus aureus]SGU30571.1 Uncharacterised protein [Staphylococcus aureus]
MLLYLSFECFLWRDSIGNLAKVNLYCNVVGILLALYMKLLCGEMLGIAPEVVMWRDVGDIDGVVCGEILAHVYSVEPENLM